MSDETFAQDYLNDLSGLLGRLDPVQIAAAAGRLREARDAGRTVFICGNGGSASISSQMVVGLVKGASFGRP